MIRELRGAGLSCSDGPGILSQQWMRVPGVSIKGGLRNGRGPSGGEIRGEWRPESESVSGPAQLYSQRCEVRMLCIPDYRSPCLGRPTVDWAAVSLGTRVDAERNPTSLRARSSSDAGYILRKPGRNSHLSSHLERRRTGRDGYDNPCGGKPLLPAGLPEV